MAKILIVDDSPVEIKIIRNFLHNEYEIIEAFDGKRAIELAVQAQPDLILLDIIMPGMDGFSVCRLLKSQPKLAIIPVIFITSATKVKDVVKGFEAGGQDYITKPFYALELCARIKVHLELNSSKEELCQYAMKLEKKNQELGILLEKLETAAMTDYITGLANRRNMMEEIKKETHNLQRMQGKSILILGDVDNFKKINDTYGHECGDFVLKKLAEIMKSILRKNDILARWGGEEFLILLPSTELDDGREIAERIRRAVESERFAYQEQWCSLTMTLAITELTAEVSFDESMRMVDAGLYSGKRKSKNCVIG